MITATKQWFHALRIPFLANTVAPVFIGTVMVFGDGIAHLPSALMILAGVVSAHIGFACMHAYGDIEKNVEHTEHLNPKLLRLIGIIVFIVSSVCAFFIFKRVGLPVIGLGTIAAILCLIYVRTRYQQKFCGLSDLIALTILGPFAVSIVYYVQSFEINTVVIIAGFAPGMFSAALIVINNICDISSDRERGKSTIAVCFGVPAAIREYFFLITAACIIPVIIYSFASDYKYTLIAIVTIFFTFPALRRVISSENTQQLKIAQGLTIRILVIYCVLFSVGWLLSVMI